jgi:glutamyl-tRNA synthetase
MSNLRVRFAPSPTGYLHIGGARTALFNWLLARKEGGTFILRIEDTDVARSTQESVDAILRAMEWLGLDYDEGPLYQSERFDLYKARVEQLLAEGKAYRCYCTAEELEARREAALRSGQKPKYDGTCRRRTDRPDAPFAVRFRAPQEGTTSFVDRIKGPISFANEELDDLIIQRSDGTPTYNFVVVVDDAEMGITLVLRGDDHINNTPRQILMYQALGYPVPEFGHVPMILGADKTRLSKRHGATSVMAYREMGYLPEAMVNYLVRLGWSHGDQEIFSTEEIQSLFGLEAVSRASAQADPAKLQWLNLHYLKTLPRPRLVEELRPFLERAVGHAVEITPGLLQLVDLLRERSRTLVEMAEGARFLASDQLAYDEKAVAKHMRPEVLPALVDLHERLAKLDAWTESTIEAAFDEVRARHGDLPVGRLAQPVRIAITGRAASPGIFETLAALGQKRSVGRLAEAIHFLRHG